MAISSLASPYAKRNTSKGSQQTIKRLAGRVGAELSIFSAVYSAFRDLDRRKCSVTDGHVMGDNFERGPNAEEEIPSELLDEAVKTGLALRDRKVSPAQLRTWFLKGKAALADEQTLARGLASTLVSRNPCHRTLMFAYAAHRSVTKQNYDALAKTPGRGGGLAGNVSEAEHLSLLAKSFRRLTTPSSRQSIVDAALDFELASGLSFDDPKGEGVRLMGEVLEAIRALPEAAQLQELVKAPQGIFKSTKMERTQLLETLGVMGILQPASQPSLESRYVQLSYAPLPSSYYKKEWCYPTCWWTGADGVNEEALAHWFPGLEKTGS